MPLDESGRIAWDKVAPQKAMEFWASRTGVTASQFTALDDAARAYAFTISGVESQAVIDAAQGAIGKAVAEGIAESEFTKIVRDAVAATGRDPMNPWHLHTVWRQNVLTSYGAGRAASQRSEAVAKYLPTRTYRAVGDDATRPSHAALNGTTRPANDSFWSSYEPPIDYNCRCWTDSGTARETDLGGVSLPPPAEGFRNPIDQWIRTAEGNG